MGSVALAFLVGLLMWFSQDCLQAATDAARVFACGVMPALFPAMVLAGLPFSQKRSENSAKGWLPMGEALLFALAAGSPAGARKVRALRDQGQISERAAVKLYITTGMVSPLFFLGSLSLWTGSPTAALLMLVAHWLSAGVTGGLCCLISKHGGKPMNSHARVACPNAAIPTPKAAQPPFLAALPQAISAAAQALLSVCGAMMLFSIAAAILTRLMEALFPVWIAANPGACAILHGLMEIGGGANSVCKVFGGQGAQLFGLLSGLCGFGGLSIWIQNLAFVGESVRPVTLLLYRSAHGAVAYGICSLLFRLLPQAAEAGAFSTALLPGPFLPPILPLAMLLILGTLGAYLQKSKTCSPRN